MAKFLDRLSRRVTTVAVGMALLAACDSDGLSSADVITAAQERVRQSLELSEDSVLFTNVFVGEPVDGDIAVCGTVEGRRADGSQIAPRRFIAAADPARWVKFGPADNVILPSQPDMFVEWRATCAGENAV